MFAFLSSLFLHTPEETAIRATLADGQILLGAVRTRVLRLATGAGLLEIPLEDVGEVVPAEGDPLGVAEGRVDVWLRNGSELRGRWSEPELAMDITVGGGKVGVNLPMNELNRMQLQGGERWPAGPVYRMHTTWGDDFLVDGTRTHLSLANQLGTFAPSLAECRFVAPVGDPTGPWRVELSTGTVLIGALSDAAVTLALPMGPEEVTVPLANFVSLRLETWNHPVATYQAVPETPAYGGGAAAPMAAPARAMERQEDAPARDEAWFDSAGLKEAKQAGGS